MTVGEEELRGVALTVHHLPVPAYALDATGVVLAWNPAIAGLTGIAGEYLVGRGGGAHAAPFIGENGVMLADLVLDPSQISPSHLSMVERNGDGLSALLTAEITGLARLLAVRAAPIVARGEVIGAVEIVQSLPPPGPGQPAPDQTLLRLLRTVRHDIKNELTIVLGYIGLARDAVLDPAARTGLDRAVAATGAVGELVEVTRELEELGREPPVICDLAALVRAGAEEADLTGIDLEIAVPHEAIVADPVIVGILGRLIRRLFRYSAATDPPPATIRVTASGTDPLLLVYEDDALATDSTLHPDRSFSRELDHDLALYRDLLSLDGIDLAIGRDPLRLELRIPGGRLQAIEKKE